MLSLRSCNKQTVSLICKRLFQTSSVMPIKAGDKLPSVDLFEGAPDKKVNTNDLKGKTVVIGVPGAFTPTCSNDHVPGFLSQADNLKGKGVENIVVVSVNDPFVMAAWGKALDSSNSNKVRFLADTTGEFTRAIDVELDLSQVLGNKRSKRYALVAENGTVKNINVEPDGVGLSCSRSTDILGLL